MDYADIEAAVPYLPDVDGMTTAAAAEAYALAGIAVVPVSPGTKNPGGYLGLRWQRQATTDLDTVRDWWRRWPNAGIAMHVGGSRLLVIDVDHPDNVPMWLWKLLEQAVFRPTTIDPNSQRGHYFYRCYPDERFGNGLGQLKTRSKTWGEVKCYGGAIVLGPTVHPRAAEGGHYSTNGFETIPLRPDELAEKLNAASDPTTVGPLTPGQLDEFAKTFLDTYADEREPNALDAILAGFDPEPGGRHQSMFSCLCWAGREAKAGCFSAARAIDELRQRWVESFSTGGRTPAADEFDRMVRDALFAADDDGTPEQLWDRAHRHIWPEPGDPRKVARRYVEMVVNNNVPIRCWNGLWLAWTGTHYRRITVEDFRDELYDLLENAYYQDDAGRQVKWKPVGHKLDKVIDAARGLVKLPPGVHPPAWLDGLTDELMIPCANGLLRLRDRALLDHTPDHFNLFTLPYGYDSEAGCLRWLQFLTEVFGDDTEAIQLLQDWFFYVLTGRTDLHKMLLWIGPKRGGKGTVARVLKKLIGADAYAGLSIKDLKSNFGLQGHIHKSLGVFPDEDQIGATDGKHLVAFIKNVTGEDDVSVDIKYEPPWNGRLPMRFMYMGNVMPVLPDPSGAVLTRLLTVRTTACFAGKEDRGLEDALTQELPGILNWALQARLAVEPNEFVQPASGQDLLADIDTHSNPVRQFLSEYPELVVGEGQHTRTTVLYGRYETWREFNGIRAYGDSRWFGRLLPSAMVDLFPDVKFGRKQHNDEPNRPWYYHGVGLRQPSSGARIT